MKSWVGALVALWMGSIGGCARGIHPQLLPDGLHAARGQFVVDYAFPDRRAIAGRAWELDNFDGEDARPGPDYETYAQIDDDGNGRPELNERVDLYDARLVRRSTGTALWLRSVPVETALGSRDLEFLALDYADAVTGGSYYAASFGRVVRERRYATEVTRRGACLWDGLPAYAIEFTVRNVDRAVIGVTDADYLVTIVLTHAPGGWRQHSRRSFASVIVAGMAGRPADATESSGAFQALLRAVRIRDEQLAPRDRGETTCPFPPASR